MPLWPSQLLADPGLGLELVAGGAGLDQRGPVRWAHISDTPDPTPWLEGGEVVLTTGLGVMEDADLQRRLIERLTDRGTVAVGFGVGVAMEKVPVAMLDACDEHGLPLFTVPYEVPFIAVTRRVSQHTFEEHYATLQRAVQLHRQVLAAVVGEGGISGVLATVGQAMPQATLLAYDFTGAEIGRHDPQGRTDRTTPVQIWDALAWEQVRHRTELDGLVITAAQVRLDNEVEGLVAAVTDEPLVEHEELLFEQGLTGVSLELARQRSVREAHRAHVTELLEEAATRRISGSELERQLHRLGTRLDGYQVLAVSRPGGVAHRALCTLVEDVILSADTAPVVGQLDGVVHAIVPSDAAVAERLVEAAKHRGWPGVRVGRSRSKSDPESLRTAIREAEVAVREGSSAVDDVQTLGLAGLLAGIRDDRGADEFVTSVLGPVLEYDAREGTDLVPTLRAYLSHGCRPGPAAKELCVHRHTLTYRLERVKELTGQDPRSGAHLLELTLALELLDA